MQVCLEVWMWLHQQYETSSIARKFYIVESNECTYLVVHNDGGMNRKNDVTYDLQRTIGKIMITITIITDQMSMHCSINIYKFKRWYQYKYTMKKATWTNNYDFYL